MLEEENCDEITHSDSEIPKILIKTGPLHKPNKVLEEVFQKDAHRFNIKEVRYFNNDDCHNFIYTYLPDLVYKAYTSLIPPAFKADLFRYCALYIIGGIYMDLTNVFVYDYNVYGENYDMIITKDMPHPSGIEGIQISFMACKPRSDFMKHVIERTTIQILQKQKGRTALDLTGPHAFQRYFMTFFGSAPQQGTHVYTHGQNNYVVKMDLVQTTKSSISIIDSLDTHVISVKSLGEKEHRRLLLDPDIPIPSKRAMGMMHDKQTYRRNSYADYWAQNKVFY